MAQYEPANAATMFAAVRAPGKGGGAVQRDQVWRETQRLRPALGVGCFYWRRLLAAAETYGTRSAGQENLP
jgi:hypothetical protein